MTREEQVLSFFERHRGNRYIRLVTGMRGCGKTHALDGWVQRLHREGVTDDHVVRIDLEDPSNCRYRSAEALLDRVDALIPAEDGKTVHVMLDEICACSEFEAVVGVLHARSRLELTLTCSNRRPLSARFREYLSGRCVHLEMLAPSFAEIPLPKRLGFEARLAHVLRYGTLPYLHAYRARRELSEIARVYHTGLWNTILVKDILTRNRLADSRLVEKLLGRIYEHLGENESLRKIAADSAIDGREVAPNTVESYLDALDESLLIRKVPKFDVFTGETLKAGYRFSLADLALGASRYGAFPGAQDSLIRNLVGRELVGRGGRVCGGRYDGRDFDFVVVKKGGLHCWQYAPELVDGGVPTPILAPLKRIPDDVRKTVIVRRTLPRRRTEGIEYVTLEQFLENPREGES